MADKVHYSSDSNNRKYNDNQMPPSASISFHSQPNSFFSHWASLYYNRVMPPMDKIQLAKQKSQEIATRHFNNVGATKRSRIENGGIGSSS